MPIKNVFAINYPVFYNFLYAFLSFCVRCQAFLWETSKVKKFNLLDFLRIIYLLENYWINKLLALIPVCQEMYKHGFKASR